MTRHRWRVLVPVLASVVVLAPLAWLWFASLVPARYSVLQMGPRTTAVDRGRSGTTTALRRAGRCCPSTGSSPTRPVRPTSGSS